MALSERPILVQGKMPSYGIGLWSEQTLLSACQAIVVPASQHGQGLQSTPLLLCNGAVLHSCTSRHCKDSCCLLRQKVCSGYQLAVTTCCFLGLPLGLFVTMAAGAAAAAAAGAAAAGGWPLPTLAPAVAWVAHTWHDAHSRAGVATQLQE